MSLSSLLTAGSLRPARRAASLGAVGAHIVLFSCAPALTAHAQAKTALSFVREPGAEACIGAVELGQRVEHVVGPVLRSASEGQVSVEGRVARGRDGFVATIVVADRAGKILGKRELRTRDQNCRVLDDQLVFVVAVAIDPDAALAELPSELNNESSDPGADLLHDMTQHPPQPAPPVRERSPARLPDAAAPQAPATRPTNQSLSLRVGARPMLGFGQLPRAAVGLGLEVDLALGARTLWVRGTGFLSQERSVGQREAVNLGFLDVALGICPLLFEPLGFELLVCSGGIAARLSAHAVGFAGNSRDRWLFGPSLEARIGRRLNGWLWAGVAAGAETLWPRHQVGYEAQGGFQGIYRVPAVLGRAAGSIEVRF